MTEFNEVFYVCTDYPELYLAKCDCELVSVTNESLIAELEKHKKDLIAITGGDQLLPMQSLSESQYHTVWTHAVDLQGYNKQFFKNLLVVLKNTRYINDKEPDYIAMSDKITELEKTIKEKDNEIAYFRDYVIPSLKGQVEQARRM